MFLNWIGLPWVGWAHLFIKCLNLIKFDFVMVIMMIFSRHHHNAHTLCQLFSRLSIIFTIDGFKSGQMVLRCVFIHWNRYETFRFSFLLFLLVFTDDSLSLTELFQSDAWFDQEKRTFIILYLNCFAQNCALDYLMLCTDVLYVDFVLLLYFCTFVNLKHSYFSRKFLV